MHENISPVSSGHVPPRSRNAVTYCTLNVTIPAARVQFAFREYKLLAAPNFRASANLSEPGPWRERTILPVADKNPGRFFSGRRGYPRRGGRTVGISAALGEAAPPRALARTRYEAERNNIIEMRLINIAKRELARPLDGPHRGRC